MSITLKDFYPINAWKSHSEKFIEDATSKRLYLNRSVCEIRLDCLKLAIGTLVLQSACAIIRIAYIIVKIATFSYLWCDKKNEKKYDFTARLSDAGKDLLTILATPLALVGMELSAIFGVISPLNGSKLYASLERGLYGSFLLAPRFQPLDTMHEFLGKFVLISPGITLDEQDRVLYLNLLSKIGGQSISIPSTDGVVLDGMFFPGINRNEKSRTVILFNGNGMLYESYGHYFECGGNSLKTFNLKRWIDSSYNVVVFNYRGAGKSSRAVPQGNSQPSMLREGLFADGEAVLNYVKEHYEANEAKITLYGHSLGAAIGSKVAADRPLVNHVNDRFSSRLTLLVSTLLNRICIGKSVGNFVAGILTDYEWEIDTFHNLTKIKGKKIVVYHPNDFISGQGSRLGEDPRLKEISNVDVIKLNPMLIQNKGNFYPDDPSLIDPNTCCLRKKLVTLLSGNIAHMRHPAPEL